jgi:hypothetical protein
MSNPALDAIVSYYKDKGYSPHGQKDSGGRWYPDDVKEAVSCCSSIRSPSHKYPWSLFKHCLSLKHIRQRIIEKPVELEKKALAMTQETAPLYVNESWLLLHVCKKLLGA